MPKTLFLLAIAAAILGLSTLDSPTASATHVPLEEVAIDVNVTGNTATSLGSTEYCNAEPLEIGETIDVDIAVRGVPPWAPGGGPPGFGTDGIWGYGFDLYFDPEILYIEKVHAADGPSLVWSGGGSGKYVVVNYGDGRGDEVIEDPGAEAAAIPPVSGYEQPGHIRVDAIDFSLRFESGDGILTRLTFRAVNQGVTYLQLADHDLTGQRFGVMDAGLGQRGMYEISQISQAALVSGSGACPQSIPVLPPPGLPPSPPHRPTVTPASTPLRTPTPTATDQGPDHCMEAPPPECHAPTPTPPRPESSAPLAGCACIPEAAGQAAASGTNNPQTGTAAGAAVSPAALPRAGGPTDGGSGPALVGLALVAGIIVGAAFFTARRKPR